MADANLIAERPLGRSGLAVSAIAFGCGPNARLMVEDDQSLQHATLRRALDLGVTYFDTAAGYGDGRSERHLGDALRALEVAPVVSTKVVLEAPDLRDVRGAVERSVARSIERLGRARLDVLVLHNRVAASASFPKPPGSGVLLHLPEVFGPRGVLEAFEALRAEGLVASLGFTAFGGERLAIDRLIESGVFDAMNASLSLLNPSATRSVPVGFALPDYEQVVGRAASAGLGVMAIRVLESGVLARPPVDPLLEQLGAMAAELGGSLVELAIRYVLSLEGVSTAILGFSEPRHVDEAAAAAAKGPLEAAAVAALEALVLGAR